MENHDTFIFLICYNCGLIANKCLESYHKYHNHPIHIFGKKSDFSNIDNHKNNVFIDLSDDEVLTSSYKNGHLGTSYIWANVVTKKYGNYSKIIQIYSDVIFLNECLNDIFTSFNEGYDLIGARRSYKTIPNLKDVVSTFFIGVNLNKITNREFNNVWRMCQGTFNPYNHKIIDFFDPVSFDILYNGGKIKYLSFTDYGSCDENNNFDNGFLEMNTLYDYGKKIIHFAGIGSGMNFHINGSGNVPKTYVEWAKNRYSLYLKLFYDKDIDIPFNNDEYELTKKFIK